MFNHAPQDYKCPICLGVQGVENDDTMLRQADLVYKDDFVSVFINSFFIDGNEGHLIVVPNKHFENLYDLDSEYGHKILDISKKIAVAVKNAYGCDGITIRQNNEPASGQHAFHYHMHIFPRYSDDKFEENVSHKRATTPEERLEYIQRIKSSLKKYE
ncbi:MAG: HIT family protein [Patescibacteria group bacterium]|nr:HIT family protein [Patescibacteria group bacterium]